MTMSETVGAPDAEDAMDTAAVASTGMGRASAVLAAGTIVSRVLGFVRTVVLVAAIGQAATGNAFSVANQLPNQIYALVAGGALSAILVPQIVKAARQPDGGQKYIDRILTLGMVIFGAVTVVATLAAPFLVSLYSVQSTTGRGFTPEATALAVAFAYWCLPQVFFYALYSLLSQVLNARNIFGPFTWAPAVNNIVSIAGIVAFMIVFGGSFSNGSAGTWDAGRIALLGATTTLGVAAQALLLFLFWKRAGLRFRPNFRWKGVGLASTGKTAGWVFGMVVVLQIAGVFQSNVASIASGNGASNIALQNAWLIFMLPHSVITVSVATAYFTRMSGYGSTGDFVSLRRDLSASLRSIGLLIVFSMVAIAVVAYPFSRFVSVDYSETVAMGNVLIAFMPGLVLFSMLFVLQRVFYSLGDTRTPFITQCVQSAVFIAGALVCATLPTQWIGVGIGIVTGVAGGTQTVLQLLIIRRRIGGVDGRRIVIRYLQYLALALLAGVVGLVIVVALGSFSADGFAEANKVTAVATIAVAGVAMAVVYFGLLMVVKNPELTSVTAVVRARFRRSR
jgi:putative peptidoglycan lipid II flippase